MILAIDVGNTNIVLGCFDSQSIRFTAVSYTHLTLPTIA